MAALGKQYLALVAPLNAALNTFTAKVNALPTVATVGDLNALAAPLVPALTTFDAALQRLPFPPPMSTDVSALIAADTAAVGDLDRAGSVAGAKVSTWLQQFSTDSRRFSAAASAVRADLGLPPNSRG